MTGSPPPSPALSRAVLLAALLLPVVSGCASTSMVPEAEPYAAAAVDSVEALDRYLEASGLTVVESRYAPTTLHPAVEESLVYDLGADGACAVCVFRTAEGARHFGPRGSREGHRDLSAFSYSSFPDTGEGGNRAGDPRLAAPFHLLSGQTFVYGRHLASCTTRGAAWRAFQSLTHYARARA